jgi:hypothetical protein
VICASSGGISSPVFETGAASLDSFDDSSGEFEASVSIENVGDEAGTFDVTLAAEGTTLETTTVTLASGETVTANVSGVITGPATVTLAGQSLGELSPGATEDKNNYSDWRGGVGLLSRRVCVSGCRLPPAPEGAGFRLAIIMNFLNAQKICVLSFTLTDQCVSSTSVNSPTYIVATPSSYSRSTRPRTSAFCAWSQP